MLCHQDRYYASSIDSGSSTIFIYRYNKSWLFKNWKKVHSFQVDRGHVTLSVCEDLITCCSADVTDIVAYSLRGEFRLGYALPGSGEVDDGVTGSSTHQGDEDGCVLICDRSSGALLVAKDGVFTGLTLEPTVQRPVCAVLYINAMYVICGAQANTVCKYSSSWLREKAACVQIDVFSHVQ